MSLATAAWASLRADGLRVARDRFLVGAAVYIIAISIAMRWAIPWVGREVATRWGFDLAPYYPLIVSHVVIQLAPLLAGILGGFLLLESREDRTIRALLVSPLPLTAYLAVLSGAMIVVSVVLTVVEGTIIGIALPSGWALVVTGLVGAMAAPTFALVTAALADNKTEAFAYLKIVGLAPLLPSGMYFVGEPLQWLATVYPPYWAVKAFWLAEAGEAAWPLWALGGVVASAAWGVLALRLFTAAARR